MCSSSHVPPVCLWLSRPPCCVFPIRECLGGAKLTAPAKGANEKVCRVVTLLAPPLTVTSDVTADAETATVKGYLVTYNEEGRLTLPPKPETIWGEAHAATAKTLKTYAKRSLADMYVEGMPLSGTLKKQLGPQYASTEESEGEEDDW